MSLQTQCEHCTIPTDGAAVCGFCSVYTPPATTAQRLDVAVNRIDLIRVDINTLLRELPTNAPLFGVVDIVAALGHLRQAAVLVDKAADQLEAVKR